MMFLKLNLVSIKINKPFCDLWICFVLTMNAVQNGDCAFQSPSTEELQQFATPIQSVQYQKYNSENASLLSGELNIGQRCIIPKSMNRKSKIWCASTCGLLLDCTHWHFDTNTCFFCGFVGDFERKDLPLGSFFLKTKNLCEEEGISGAYGTMDSCYVLYERQQQAMDKTAAEATCADRQMHLVYLETKQEFYFVVNFLTADYSENVTYVLTGGFRYIYLTFNIDVWVWGTSYGDPELAYDAWHPNEPSPDGNYDTLQLQYANGSYAFDDTAGDHIFSFLCELDRTVEPDAV